MIGIPPTGGFFGKWYIVLGAIEAGEYAAVAAVIVATLLTLAYFAGLLVRVFGGQAVAAPPTAAAADAAAAAGLCRRLCAPASSRSGLFSDRIVGVLLDRDLAPFKRALSPCPS